jgi:hypothetical protein
MDSVEVEAVDPTMSGAYEMLLANGIADWQVAVIAFLLAAVIAWGFTEGLKRSARAYLADTGAKDPFWWQAVWRFVPATLGAVTAGLIYPAPLGPIVGTAAGLLCAFVVRLIKRRLEATIGGEGVRR